MLTVAILAAGPCAAGKAGPLRIFTPGGPDGAVTNRPLRTQSDLDMMRPAFLPDQPRSSLTLSVEYENVLHQRRDGQTLHDDSARKQKAELVYLFQPDSAKYKTAIAIDRYVGATAFLTNDNIRNTRLNTGESTDGGSVAIGQQISKVRIGLYRNDSRDAGLGFSGEINEKISLLDSNAAMRLSLKTREEGLHLAALPARKWSVGYLLANEDIKAELGFFDADDDFLIRGNLSGEKREVHVRRNLSPVYSIDAFFTSGAYESLDPILYNGFDEIGRWLSLAKYDAKSLFLTKTGSPTHSWNLGVEDQAGFFRTAAVVDVLGEFFNLTGQDYLLHLNGNYSGTTWKGGWRAKKSGWGYRLGYARTTGRLSAHYDVSRPLFLGIGREYLDVEDAGYRAQIHKLGLGVEKDLSKDVSLAYSIVQLIPDVEEIGAGGQASPGSGGAPQPKKKSRGGTLHILSARFLF